MADLSREIRGVMIPVTGARLLLPNASVAEVITFSTPETVPDAPAWLLGRLPWRGWRLPLFSFSILAGRADAEVYNNARVVVLKALGGNAQFPFLALLAQGFPRLTTITPDLLIANDDDGERATGINAEVIVRDDPAVIPDLAAIETLVAEALAASGASQTRAPVA
ncbi:MAG TPA: chemotaxis protein CheW [Rhodanobacteraceae bacterium]|nr:chemotaxis protein CheW [Rhodanobacteraceae bacterium]